MKIWMTILAAMVIFCTGAISGGLAVKLYDAHHRAQMARAAIASGPGWNQRADLLKRIERHITLTPAQREQIEQILSDSQTRMKAIWGRVAPEAREEYKIANQRILAQLTPEQQKVFEELIRVHPIRREHSQTNRVFQMPSRSNPPVSTNKP